MRQLGALLESRIDARLARIVGPSDQSRDVDLLLAQTTNPARFDSQEEFRKHLREGALLDVSVIASRALSIPNGEYAVWTTNAGHTVLVPTASPRGGDMVTGEAPQYELHTKQLLGSWNRISRTIAEDEMGGQQFGGQQQGGRQKKDQTRQQDHYANAPSEMPEGPYTFGSKIGRSELWQAMKDRNMGDSELADAVGVDKSTISRLLRKVEKGQEEPGGRNPSAELAMKISRVLGVPIDLVMPPESELIGKKRTGSSGSGKQGTMSRSRNGLNSIGQGANASAESRDRERWLARISAQTKTESKMVRIAEMIDDLGVNPLTFLGRMVDADYTLAEAGFDSRSGMLSKGAHALGSGLHKLSNHMELSNFRKAIAALSGLKKQFGSHSASFSAFLDKANGHLAKAHERLATALKTGKAPQLDGRMNKQQGQQPAQQGQQPAQQGQQPVQDADIQYQDDAVDPANADQYHSSIDLSGGQAPQQAQPSATKRPASSRRIPPASSIGLTEKDLFDDE